MTFRSPLSSNQTMAGNSSIRQVGSPARDHWVSSLIVPAAYVQGVRHGGGPCKATPSVGDGGRSLNLAASDSSSGNWKYVPISQGCSGDPRRQRACSQERVSNSPAPDSCLCTGQGCGEMTRNDSLFPDIICKPPGE